MALSVAHVLCVYECVCPSVIEGILCAQLLQFHPNLFETLQMFFFSWSEDVHVFGYNPQINFCHFFSILNLSHFSGLNTTKVNR